MIIVQYIYYDAWGMYGLNGENLYLCEWQIQFFSLLFTDNTFTHWFQLDSSTAMYSKGKISKGGELEMTVRVISLPKITR